MTGGSERPPRRVLCFGTYDRDRGRSVILIEGLRAAGVEVVECHARLWSDTDAKLDAVRLGARSVLPAWRALGAWRAILRSYRAAPDYDLMLVGATAHLDLPLARVLARARGRPLVFDPLVSVVETVRDRGLLADGSPRLAAIARAERALFRLPDRVIVDSAAHGALFAREALVVPARQIVVPAGAPSACRRLATPLPIRAPGAPFRVAYFGQYIPLHGLDVVLDAAARLVHRADITFELVGRGQRLPATRARAAQLGLPNVRFDPEWVPIEDLVANRIAAADLCLGVFGAQPKADRVVPFKVYTSLAAGRPVVTAHTTAMVELLRPGTEVWTVPAADSDALAAAIATLADHPALCASLAAAGQAAYDARFAPPVLGRRLRESLEPMWAGRDLARPGEGRA